VKVPCYALSESEEWGSADDAEVVPPVFISHYHSHYMAEPSAHFHFVRSAVTRPQVVSATPT